jgi:hypothetical protein
MIKLKELAIFTFGMIYFMLISLPLGVTLFLTAHLFFEVKRIIKWITN